MKIRTLLAGSATLAAVAAAAGSLPAHADATQTVTATVGSSLALGVSKADVALGTLAAGTNSFGGNVAGTLSASSNVAYSVSVASAKPTMTKYTGSYDDNVRLTSPLVVTATSTDVGATPAGAVPVGTVAAPIATGVLGSHTYDLGFTQLVSVTDAPATYRNELTYSILASL